MSRDSAWPLQMVRKSPFDASYHHFQTEPDDQSSEPFWYFACLFLTKNFQVWNMRWVLYQIEIFQSSFFAFLWYFWSKLLINRMGEEFKRRKPKILIQNPEIRPKPATRHQNAEISDFRLHEFLYPAKFDSFESQNLYSRVLENY